MCRLFLIPTHLRAENDTPRLWPRAFANASSPVPVNLGLQAEEEVKSELELWESFEASWEARTREGLPNSASVKVEAGIPDRSWTLRDIASRSINHPPN